MTPAQKTAHARKLLADLEAAVPEARRQAAIAEGETAALRERAVSLRKEAEDLARRG